MKTKLIFILAMLPLVASADDGGSCGENVSWHYVESTKILTISGTGKMDDLSQYNRPWGNYVEDIAHVIIKDGVKSIGQSAFMHCKSLNSVNIGDSVKIIGFDAFLGCHSLTSVKMGKSVEMIVNGAFTWCDALTSITLPESLTSIDDKAFNYCKSLTSITIPKNVRRIGTEVFAECPNLATIKVDPENEILDSRENCNAIIHTWDNILVTGCKNSTIPNGVTGIASGAFAGCCYMTSITIPSSVTRIGGSAFSGCNGLSNVYCYAEEVPQTDSYAFSTNVEFDTLHVPEASISAYKADKQWSVFFKTVALENETKPVKGNLNGDDVVDSRDLLMLLDMITGKLEVTAAADVNGDGKVDVADVVKLVSIMIGKE